MNTKKLIIASLAVAADMVLATVPEVTSVRMEQAVDRLVTITYTLADAPAVITFDVQTNADTSAAANDFGWTSIGGSAIWNATGDVWTKVETGAHAITWRPDLSWPDHKIADGGARAVVTAWALDNTPDYMVVDLATENTVRYYPGVEFLPGTEIGQTGAVTNNSAYRTTQLLMRKIMPVGVEWTMGSTAGESQRFDNEATHKVMLTNSYYIGVFEVTQAQWRNIATNSSITAQFTVDGAMRPMEKVCYNEIRLKANSNADATSSEIAENSWPNAPHPSSFLGLLHLKTGIVFDLPSEAQWEFAARAGNGSGFWNDGSVVANTDADANLGRLGRYVNDNPGGTATTATFAPDAGGSAIAGSYAPNGWGLYDMHGNVWELCLDWYEDDITARAGWVNIDPVSPACALSGLMGANRVSRGGSWRVAAGSCRPAYRFAIAPTTRSYHVGFRVVCRAGLR